MPSIWPHSTLFGSLSLGILAKWPSHLTFQWLTIFESLATLRQPKILSSLILSFKLTLQTFLRQFISITSSLCSCCLGSAHVSLAYSKVDCTLITYNVHFIPFLRWSSSHTSSFGSLNQLGASISSTCYPVADLSPGGAPWWSSVVELEELVELEISEA